MVDVWVAIVIVIIGIFLGYSFGRWNASTDAANSEVGNLVMIFDDENESVHMFLMVTEPPEEIEKHEYITLKCVKATPKTDPRK